MVSGAPSPTIGRTPPPGSPGGSSAQNVACFGHFERELEYRYSFRALDFQVHNGFLIFSSLDNVYIKLIVHEAGLAGLPRDPTSWQSVGVKFISHEQQRSSWCYLTFRRDGNKQQTFQAELPMNFDHFSMLLMKKSVFILSQSRLNALNDPFRRPKP